MSNSHHAKTELPLPAILGGPGVALALMVATSTLSKSIAVANVALGLALLTTYVSTINWQGGLTTTITGVGPDTSVLLTFVNPEYQLLN